MAGRAAGCRHDQDAGQDLGLAVQRDVRQPGRVDEFGNRVVASAGGGQLGALGEDRAAGQQRVAAAVVGSARGRPVPVSSDGRTKYPKSMRRTLVTRAS
jgi:hypothetical protein